jgi:hypothetical protein
MALNTLQVWLVHAIREHSPVVQLMQTQWAWPIAESFHFLGLCLLVGCIGAFDLRLLGVMRRVPIATVHRLIPVGLVGFGINIVTGSLFLLTEPDQYIYNSSFHWKLLFLAIAGVNASLFYLTSYRRVFTDGASLDAPRRAKVIAAVSLCAWVGVISAGRLLTFYRPTPCTTTSGELLLTCDPG